MLFKAVLPIGARCTRNVPVPTGGSNQWIREIDAYRDEMAALRAGHLDDVLSASEHADYWAQVILLHARAASGLLRFFPKPEEAKAMDAVSHIIELRPLLDDDAPAFGRPARQVRVYFAEPEDLPDSLLGLHVATKNNGADEEREQTASVREAGRRAEQWAGEQALRAYG